MKKQIREISIILPTYNERDNLSLLVKLLHKSLANLNYELIIVDDNSPDGTGQLAEELSQKYPIRVIHKHGKKDLASAIIQGFQHASGEVIGKMDADFQHPPEKIPQFLGKIEEGAEIVIGSRYAKEGSTQDWLLPRKIISKGARFLAHIFFPSARKIKDPLSGFFFFKKEIIKGVHFQSISHQILLEILTKGNYQKIVETPYIFGKRIRGKSKLSLEEFRNYLNLLWKLKKDQKSKK